ncbi:MAG: sensor domain-containing diguanylate cyclase [Candidatus Marinimicrobia bacterium]|nr:sensor domain-containing diguanylate cyclase [Candidatus Neomarinimicrobiota bacterium]
MSRLRHAFSSDNSSKIGVILAFAILFLLFVYPNPEGLIFGLLRMAFLGLAVFLFIQFYQQEKKIGSTDSGKGMPSTIAENQPTAFQGEKKDITEEYLSFIKCLEAFQGDLDISRSREELVDSITDFCRENFTFDKLTLIFLDAEKKDVAVAEEVMGYKDDFDTETRFSREESLLWKVLDGENSTHIDLTDESFLDGGRFSKGDTQDHHFFSFIGAPIQTSGRTIGCLVLESFSSGRYRRNEGRNLHIFSTRLGVLLDWWQKYDVVRETAMRDGLTGLLNHRSFVERFQQELQRANRYNEKLVLMMLDLDKFKRINDTYGHLYGDYVLRGTSAVLKNGVRNIDIVARYGGEEFAIVLVKTTKTKSFNSAKRIVQSLADHQFEKEGQEVQMTISAGMAEYPTDGEGMRDLIAIADRAMYTVKGRGGNDVEVGEVTQ